MQQIMDYYYPEPHCFHELYIVSVPKGWESNMNPLQAKPVVPVEHLMAFIMCLGLYDSCHVAARELQESKGHGARLE